MTLEVNIAPFKGKLTCIVWWGFPRNWVLPYNQLKGADECDLCKWVRQKSSYHCCYWWCCCFRGQNQILLFWFCRSRGAQVDIIDLLVCENNRRCHTLSFSVCMCISKVTSCMCTAERRVSNLVWCFDVRLMRFSE